VISSDDATRKGRPTMYRPDSRVVIFAALVATVCLAVSPASAAFVNLTPAGGNGSISATSALLSDLVGDPTGGLIVGDKVFTGFGYSKIGDMPESSAINVLGIKDVQGNWGITFHGAFLDLPGGGSSDALIRYAVEVDLLNSQLGVRITDAHLNIGGVGAGDEGFFSVDESFTGRNETMSVFFSTLGPTTPPADAQLSDFTLITPPAQKLFVTKDILAIAAANSTQPTRATAIDQSFSQIPEPAAIVMLGLSGLALVSVSRRRG
jgi:hypothetical protein